MACRRLLPQHGTIEPQGSAPPYELSFVREVGGNSWLVTIRGVTPFFTFRGIIIQARSADAPDVYDTLGTFSRPVESETLIKAVDCLQPNDTVTHTFNQDKSQIQVRWTKPATGSGSVIFR